MKKLTLSLATLALAAGSAHAQDAATLPADETATLPEQPAADTPPAAPRAGVTAAPAASSSAISDAEVQSYASATVKVHEISKNTALDDQAKQQQMASAVTDAGLDPERFNAISAALGSDTALRTRVETALAAHAAAHQG